jgi:hypothetical protein
MTVHGVRCGIAKGYKGELRVMWIPMHRVELVYEYSELDNDNGNHHKLEPVFDWTGV